MQGRPIKVRVTLADSEYEGVTADNDLDIVSLVEFAILIDDEEGDVVPTGIPFEAGGDFMDAAVHRGLDSPDVVVVEGLACRGGNMRHLNSFNGGECDLVVLDGIPGKRAGCVGPCGDVTLLGFQVGEGVILAVDGSGVRGLLILQGGDEERS